MLTSLWRSAGGVLPSIRMNLWRERGEGQCELIQVVRAHAGNWRDDPAPETPGKNLDHTLNSQLASRQPSLTHKKTNKMISLEPFASVALVLDGVHHAGVVRKRQELDPGFEQGGHVVLHGRGLDLGGEAVEV